MKYQEVKRAGGLEDKRVLPARPKVALGVLPVLGAQATAVINSAGGKK